MSNDIIEITDETKKILSNSNEAEFDEQEAYFLLCEIFSHAQATKDYAKFQIDLTEWKKRFPIDKFHDPAFKAKIQYMLSKEFLDTVLKNFVFFDELSRKDPAQGLKKLDKILDKAKKHKDAKQLDKDLEDLYKEYPLSYLKEKYPHEVPQRLSKSNRTKILQKLDEPPAIKELNNIVQNPQNFKDADDFIEATTVWQNLYPTADFSDKNRPQVERILTEALDPRKLEEHFPPSTELDLSLGEVIPLELKDSVKNISLVSKNALHDFFKIVNKNKGDVDSLFKWICTYNKYINSFDPTIKNTIVENLMTKYAYELPPVNTRYQIPKMENSFNDLLSFSDYKNIDDTKKQVLLQVLGILSTGKELTHEDIYRLAIIDANVTRAEEIKESKIEENLDTFMKKFPEDELTPSLYLEQESDTRIDISIDTDVELTLNNNETDDIVVEDVEVHSDEPASFKEALKVEETLEKVNVSGNNSSTDGSSSSGGSSVSATSTEIDEKQNDTKLLEDEETDKEDKVDETPKPIQAVVLESEPKKTENENILPEKEIPKKEYILPELEEAQPEIPTPDLKEPQVTAPVIEEVKEHELTNSTPEIAEPKAEVIEPEPSKEVEVVEQETIQEDNNSHKKPVQNFFSKLFGRDDDRDDR